VKSPSKLTAEEAFQTAGKAIRDLPYHEQPGSVIIAPVGDHYTVTFLDPASKGLSPEKEPGFIEVEVQAETGAALQIKNHARVGRQDPRYAGLLPSSRAYQIALQPEGVDGVRRTRRDRHRAQGRGVLCDLPTPGRSPRGKPAR
jgi:hypothetical protein